MLGSPGSTVVETLDFHPLVCILAVALAAANWSIPARADGSLEAGEIVTAATYYVSAQTVGGIRLERSGIDDHVIAVVDDYTPKSFAIADADTLFLLGKHYRPDGVTLDDKLWKVDVSSGETTFIASFVYTGEPNEIGRPNEVAVGPGGDIFVLFPRGTIFRYDADDVFAQPTTVVSQDQVDEASQIVVARNGDIYLLDCPDYFDDPGTVIRVRLGDAGGDPEIETILQDEDGVHCQGDMEVDVAGNLILFASVVVPTEEFYADQSAQFIEAMKLYYGDYINAEEPRLVAVEPETGTMTTLVERAVLTETSGYFDYITGSDCVGVDLSGAPLVAAPYSVYRFDPPTEPGQSIPMGAWTADMEVFMPPVSPPTCKSASIASTGAPTNLLLIIPALLFIRRRRV